jgi:hypothetical protein
MRDPRRAVATVVAVALAAAVGLSRSAFAAEPAAAVPAPPPVATAGSTTPEGLLAAADAAVDAGSLDLARDLYQQIVAEHPQAPEASEARRALKIIAARARSTPAGVAATTAVAGAPAASAAARGGDGIVLRDEPYSLRTSERLRLTAWEKLDFGTTAFLYGLSIGFSYSLSLDNPSSGAALTPIAIGALAYTAGAVAFLNLANPDRGDLPLALAITSYIPTTTLLFADAAFDNPSSKRVAGATVVAGVVSIPIAVIAAKELDLDPGDTQLVRDAGFWGLVLGTTGTLAFGGSTTNFQGFSEYQSPTNRQVSVAGLVGLYGGLGLGLAGAHLSNVSLERVRVTTWGGYGGAIVGLLIGAAAGGSTPDAYRGLSIGALLGLAVTFLSTSGLDGIPPEGGAAARPAAFRLTPTMQPVMGFNGQPHPALGLSGTLF